GRAAVAAGVVPDHAVGRGERGQQRLPDPRVADARVQQDERRGAAAAVIGPYLAAVDGDHRLSHEPGLSPTGPAPVRLPRPWRVRPGSAGASAGTGRAGRRRAGPWPGAAVPCAATTRRGPGTGGRG